MTTIAVVLSKNFEQSTKQDVKRLLVRLNSRVWSDATKENHRETVKKFWRWLRGVKD